MAWSVCVYSQREREREREREAVERKFEKRGDCMYTEE